MGIVNVLFHPIAKVEAGIAQITAVAQSALRQLPPGTTPPFILTYNASSVPILQLGISSETLNEGQLTDLAVNFLRVQLAGVEGASIPYPSGGKIRQVNVDLNPQALLRPGVSATEL